MAWTIVVLGLILLHHTCIGQQQWSYTGKTGPKQWYQQYPACAESRQSPINIRPEAAERSDRLTSFDFYGYNDTSTLQNLTVWNDGYTITIRIHGKLLIERGGLKGRYSLQHFHFHWGARNSIGSEHWMNGRSYPLELHLVHQTVRYDDISLALKDPIGLAVLGIFVKLGKPHPNFQTIIDALLSLEIGDSAVVRPFPMDELLPSDKDTYYRYLGSLTTPPCSESVVWTVFHQPVEMSLEQMNQIRSLGTKMNITRNFRPIQSLNGRRIFIRKKSLMEEGFMSDQGSKDVPGLTGNETETKIPDGLDKSDKSDDSDKSDKSDGPGSGSATMATMAVNVLILCALVVNTFLIGVFG